jgi:hypothetical protein
VAAAFAEHLVNLKRATAVAELALWIQQAVAFDIRFLDGNLLAFLLAHGTQATSLERLAGLSLELGTA